MTLLAPIVTKSGWIYSKAALYHPEGYIRGVPEFYPNSNGNRFYDGKTYSRFPLHLPPSLAPLQPYKQDLYTQPSAVAIPESEVIRKVSIFEKFDQLTEQIDERISLVLKMIHLANIPSSKVGVGGSRALGMEHESSDIDLLIFGEEYVAPCLKVLEDLTQQSRVTLTDNAVANEVIRKYCSVYNLQEEKYRARLLRILNSDLMRLYINQKKVSVIFVYDNLEMHKIPETIYLPAAQNIELSGVVISSTSSLLYPRKFLIKTDQDIYYTLWSHHWPHRDFALRGMKVKAFAGVTGPNMVAITSPEHWLLPLMEH
jgi:predicted nucleotidyltransferase